MDDSTSLSTTVSSVSAEESTSNIDDQSKIITMVEMLAKRVLLLETVLTQFIEAQNQVMRDENAHLMRENARLIRSLSAMGAMPQHNQRS